MRRTSIVLTIGILCAVSSCLFQNKIECTSLAKSMSLIKYELELQRSLVRLPEIDGLSRGTWLQLTVQHEEFQEKYLNLNCRNYI
jgi:hypothetical protein